MFTKIARVIIGAAFLATAGLVGNAFAGDKAPETPAEHEQAAKDFTAKAKEHRAESQMHVKMAEMYGARITGPMSKKPNPWLANMVKHCKKLAAKTEELAVMEEKAVEFHTAQAKTAATPTN